MSATLNCRSPSVNARASNRAAAKPERKAAPYPWLISWWTARTWGWAPASSAAMVGVASREPSSTMMISKSPASVGRVASASSTSPRRFASSLWAGKKYDSSGRRSVTDGSLEGLAVAVDLPHAGVRAARHEGHVELGLELVEIAAHEPDRVDGPALGEKPLDHV